MEDYLTAIYHLCCEEGVARVKGISERLRVTNASVVGVLKNLKRRNLVRQAPYGYIRLTEQGERIATSVVHRHEILAHFLEKILLLNPDIAARDACRIEHAVSPETVKRLRILAEFIDAQPKRRTIWEEEVNRSCVDQEGREKE